MTFILEAMPPGPIFGKMLPRFNRKLTVPFLHHREMSLEESSQLI